MLNSLLVVVSLNTVIQQNTVLVSIVVPPSAPSTVSAFGLVLWKERVECGERVADKVSSDVEARSKVRCC